MRPSFVNIRFSGRCGFAFASRQSPVVNRQSLRWRCKYRCFLVRGADGFVEGADGFGDGRSGDRPYRSTRTSLIRENPCASVDSLIIQFVLIRVIRGKNKEPQSYTDLGKKHAHPRNQRSRSQLTTHYSQLGDTVAPHSWKKPLPSVLIYLDDPKFPTTLNRLLASFLSFS